MKFKKKVLMNIVDEFIRITRVNKIDLIKDINILCNFVKMYNEKTEKEE